MKALYQFLILCSIFLFSFQQCHYNSENQLADKDTCLGKDPESGGKCCYYNGTWKQDGLYANCSEFVVDEVYGHVKEVKKKLLAGTYWNKITTDSQIMSNLDYFECQLENSSSKYITIGLLAFVSLLFLLL